MTRVRWVEEMATAGASQTQHHSRGLGPASHIAEIKSGFSAGIPFDITSPMDWLAPFGPANMRKGDPSQGILPM